MPAQPSAVAGTFKETISVIIPVYNHAAALPRSWRSILAQTRRPDEVVVVDDGSTDDIAGVMKTLISVTNFFPVKFLRQTNQGAPCARNRGLAAACGSLIIFWDADTVARPDMLARLEEALNNHPDKSYAYSRFKFGWKTMRSHAFDPALLKTQNYIDTTSLIRRRDFPAAGWDTTLKRFQDWDLWLTMLSQNKTGVFLPAVLYAKIVHDRMGMSRWLPRFVYRLPFQTRAVRAYEEAKQIILKKHRLS